MYMRLDFIQLIPLNVDFEFIKHVICSSENKNVNTLQNV